MAERSESRETNFSKAAKIRRMPKSQSKAARTGSIRDQVLETALKLFCERGYFNTSIHDIQQASNVSMGSIYNYFAGKGAIAQALYDCLLGRMEVVVDTARASDSTAYGQGQALLAALFELTESEPLMMSFILNARHQEFLTDKPPICSSRPFVKMRDIVSQGMASGEVRKLDPWLAASLAYGPAIRMMVLRLDGLLEQPVSNELAPLWEASWNAIRNPSQDDCAKSDSLRSRSRNAR